MNTGPIRSRALASALLITGGLLASAASHADDREEIERLKAQIEQLSQRVQELDRKQAQAAETASAAKKNTAIAVADKSGFALKSDDGQFEYRLRGLVQIDYRDFGGSGFPSANNGFLARRIRPAVEGTIFGDYGFRLTPDFGESADGSLNKVRMVDAYVDARYDPAFQLRLGKQKPFVGLERLLADLDTKFIERSYVSNNLLPNRDFGLSVFGDLMGKKLSYAVGVFNGATDGSESGTGQDANSGKEYTARLFATPFAGGSAALKGLGFGIAATTNKFAGDSSLGSGLPSYKTPGQVNSFFSYASSTYANGDRVRYAPQAYYTYGPLALLLEYAAVRQDVIRGASTATLTNTGAQISASWMLTGEQASFSGVKPARPLRRGGDGLGAFELLARYQENRIDRAAFSGGFVDAGKSNADSASTWGIGLNWYLNDSSKFAVNYDHTVFGGGTGVRSLDGKTEDFLVARYQLAF